MEKTMKRLTLRFFDVSYPSLTSENSLVEKLSGKLSSSASSRMMLLNKSDPDKSDLISDFLYTLSGKRIIAGTYLRIANSSDVSIITQDMLAQNQFKVSTINKDASAQEKTCLDYFYFCMSDDKLIVTLDSRKTINRMETYVNWLLNTTSTGNRVSFTPIVDSTKISAADLKKITINNGSSIFVDSGDNHQEDKENSSVIRLAKDALRKLFDETDTLDELIEENICSAQLVIKFTKPRNMGVEEYRRKTIGAALKPIEEPESVKIQTNGKKIKGSEILKTEEIAVDVLEGLVSEQEVYQKMITIMRRLLA